ncbi:MAG: phosphatase PAP2 family protein [Ferruginibacter sp.]
MTRKITIVLVLLTSMQLSFSQKNDNHLPVGIDTLNKTIHSKDEFKIKKLYAPALLIIAGVAVNSNNPERIKKEIVEERNEHWLSFRTHIDDYLQFSPIALAYTLDAAGVRSRTDIKNRTAILIKGELGMTAVTFLLKKYTHEQRPDLSNYASFPSGHTAQAFAAATFLSEEYKHRLKWMPYVSYGIATSVGLLRMANNKHYISDVLVGAGIGILSVKLSYWTHQYKWNRSSIRNHDLQF